MITYTIEYDLTELKKLTEMFPKGMTTAALPNTDAAFGRAAQKVRQMWTDYLTGNLQLPGIETPSKVTSAMVRSIRSQNKTTDTEFHHTVSSDNRQLEQLNEGTKEVEYDMKRTHPYGNKSRVTQSGKNKGVPYLIIPFRWGTPNGKGTKRAHTEFISNMIPTKMYETNVKGLEVSSKNALKNYFEKNFKGENIERQGYNWVKGSRLKDVDAWDDRSVGLVRMLDDRRKNVKDSVYFTFRIISAKSPASSWIYHKDAKPALNYMQALENAARPEIDRIINDGLRADEQFYRDHM